MTLFEQWTKLLNSQTVTKEEWDDYLMKETHFYKDLLSQYQKQDCQDARLTVRKTVPELCKTYQLKSPEAIGLLDGIRESLTSDLDLNQLDETSEVELNVDLRTLYLNMLKVKATWLSSLEEWNPIFSPEIRKEIKNEYVSSITAKSQKEAGRNDPCPCGSGKKYKKCCGAV